VQEECCISRVPNLTLRDVTERAETIEVGSNLLTGSEPEAVLEAVRVALETNRAWSPPPEYLEAGVSSTVARIVLGFLFQNSGQ
ncbi:MAG: UDP-N-acetylglucosamine 2-epimerase, partial [Burkholderiales bacterium]